MPKKQIKVREHDRRKPHQESRTHVDRYVREQEIGTHHGRDIEQEFREINSIEEELHPDFRYCEICGDFMDPKGMIKLPGGEWLCKGCNEENIFDKLWKENRIQSGLPKSNQDDRNNFFKISRVSPTEAEEIMKTAPGLISPDGRTNYSPTMREMIKIAKENNGKLFGHAAPSSGYVFFDGFVLDVSEAKAQEIVGKLAKTPNDNDTSAPDEFSKVKSGYRFWWD
jgi:RNA polymerase-binding transcription factor DksA